MKYILATKEKCLEHSLRIAGHITKDDKVVLNEKEIMFNPTVTGSFEERAAQMDGTIYTAAELLNLIYN